MANATFNAAWTGLSDDLKQQFLYEFPTDAAIVPQDRESAFQHLAATYVNYIQLFRKLEFIYDQMLHPQKRRLIRNLLMALMGRIVEIKTVGAQQMTELDAADFHSFEGFLLDFKLIPDDLDVPIPRFFIEENIDKLKAREKLLNDLKAKTVGDTIVSRVSFQEFTLEQAVLVIQINERGRQGRMRAKYMKDIRAQEMREAAFDNDEDDMEVSTSALTIQRIWRGYRARKIYQAMKEEELVFLGMARPDPKKATVMRNKLNTNLISRKALQQQHEEEYQNALVSIKEKLRKVEGPDIKEFHQDAFRQWYMDYKRINNKFPDFPEMEEWINPLFKFGQSLLPVEPVSTQAVAVEGNKKDAKVGSAKAPAKNPAKAPAKAAKGGKEKPVEEEEKIEMPNAQSTYLQALQLRDKTYEIEWRKKDETDNQTQKHDVGIIKEEKRGEVDLEVKVELYNVLKEELENLKLAVEKDTKKGKGKKGKGAAGKKKKKEKGSAKKGRKEKDLTGGKPIDELVQELIEAGIMQRAPSVRLSEFKGEPNPIAVPRDKPILEPPLADVRRIIAECCVLPLGLENADDSMKTARSILLYGPPGVGKSMLANTVVTEAGAALFNLTPRNTAGQYVGKANVSRMIYSVFKVAKALAPSVIFLDDAGTVFAKKVAKDDTSDPKRIKKDLCKQINLLKPSMRVLVIGCTNRPFDSDMKGLTDAFQKQVYISRPNYATRLRMWRDWVEREVGSDHRATTSLINFSVLSKMCEGYTGEIISSVIKRVLNSRRLSQLPQKLIQTQEFVYHLLQLPEANKSVNTDFKEWTAKLPLFKKRAIIYGGDEAVEEPVAAKDKGAKASPKKK